MAVFEVQCDARSPKHGPSALPGTSLESGPSHSQPAASPRRTAAGTQTFSSWWTNLHKKAAGKGSVHPGKGSSSSSHQLLWAGEPGLSWRAAARARCRPQLAWIICTAFLIFPFCTFFMPGTTVGQVAILTAAAALAYGTLIFRGWDAEAPHMRRFALWFLALLAEVMFENLMVWLVAASDQHKYDDPPGLQDNLELAVNWLADRQPLLHWLVHVQWTTTAHFLAAVLALVAASVWGQHPYSGFGMMSRFCATICCTRLIRTAAFTTTVLPSPRPGCYRERFPPPPDTFWATVKVGVSSLRGAGGCNDLVFSGHGSFWTMAPLMFTSYYPGHPAVGVLLWGVLVQASVRNVLVHNHYSLDMLLAPVVTAAVWTWVRHVYPESALLAAAKAPKLVQVLVGDSDSDEDVAETKQVRRIRIVATTAIMTGLFAAVILIFVAKA